MSEHDIVLLQSKKLLLGEGKEEVVTIWKELSDRCPLVDASSRTQTASPEYQIVFTEKLKDEASQSIDVCVACSPNGSDIAQYDNADIVTFRVIMTEIKQHGLSCCSFKEDVFNETEVEKRISNSFALIAVLTAGALETHEMIFALQAATFHYKELSRIVLVHAAESCYFPVPPEAVSKCFSEKAITWLSCYAEEGVQQIIQKVTEEQKVWKNTVRQQELKLHEEDLHTRVFLR